MVKMTMKKDEADFDFEIAVLELVRKKLDPRESRNKPQTITLEIPDNDSDDWPGKKVAIERLRTDGAIKGFSITRKELIDEQVTGAGMDLYYIEAKVTAIPKEIESHLSFIQKEKRFTINSEGVLAFGGLQLDTISGEARYGGLETKLGDLEKLFLKTLLEAHDYRASDEVLCKAVYHSAGSRKKSRVTKAEMNKLENIPNNIKRKLNMGTRKGKNPDIFLRWSGSYELFCE